MRSRSRPFAEARGEIVGGLKAGLSLAAAARQAGVAPRTAESWCTRGRREPDSAHAEFLAAVEAAREVRVSVPSGPISEAELREVVARQARSGNVQAARLAWDMLRAVRQPAQSAAKSDPLVALDELAAARVARQASGRAS